MDSVTQGTLVAERYRLIRAIGFGGMGTVWLAYDQALDCPCAVKLIGATQARQEEFRIRFECEAKCAAQLRGAHVVDVLNRGVWQGKPFIVMEYMEGEDLGVRFERVGRLDPIETYRIVAQVARALMRAHALGIVHRDIKPGNIFLAPGDEHEIAKILDFGVAKHRALPNAFESPSEVAFIGTPCYMSPEQAQGDAVDWRSDLWALAVVVFECLTGDVPYPQEEIVDIVAAITRDPVPSLIERRPDLPPALEAWWRRATAKDRQHRFQSAKDFADALADAIGYSPRLPIADFPHAAAEAPTLFVPLGAPASQRAPLVDRRLAPRGSYDSDAGVAIYSDPPTEGELAAFLPGYRRRRSPYLLGATAACAALALALGAYRPALADAASGFGLASMARSINPQQAAVVGASAATPRVEPAALEPPVAAVPVPAHDALPSHVTEPVVVTVAASAVAKENAPPPSGPAFVARKANNWRPLAPPAPASWRGARSYPRAGAAPTRDARPTELMPTEQLRTEPLEDAKDYGI